MRDFVGNVGAVFTFEWRRSFTAPRLAWLAALGAFPPAIVVLINIAISNASPRDRQQVEPWTLTLFVLGPMVVSMLGVFLWATPAVSSELEQRSWTYLAVRPNGNRAVLLGKYLVAVTWTLPSALIGITIAVILTAVPFSDAFRLWLTLVRLIIISTLAYGAIYSLIGVIMQKRAMVVAVAYTLVLEVFVGWIPAMINQFTVQFRLRSLLVDWMGMRHGEIGRAFMKQNLLSAAPTWHHIAILFCGIVFVLGTALAVLHFKEFSSASETDT